MGGVGEELALLAPGLFHRGGGPAGEQNGHAQKQNQSRQHNEKIRAHQPVQHGSFHGHVHKGDVLVQAVVLAQIAQAVAFHNSLLLGLGKAVLQDVGKRLRIIQAGIGSAGDIGIVAPYLHGEIGQQDPVAADGNADVRTEDPFPVSLVGFLNNPLKDLAAQGFGTALDGEIHGQEHDCQNSRDHGHTDRHKFQPQLSDQGGSPPLHGIVEKFVENVEKPWKNR